MNPSDLIKLFKLFSSVEKVDIITIANHLRRLLKGYVEMIAETKHFFNLVSQKKMMGGLFKLKHQNEEWFHVRIDEKGKLMKSFLRINEKRLFDNKVFESIIRRINLNDENSVNERREVDDLLRWWIVVRKEILDLEKPVFREDDGLSPFYVMYVIR